MSTYNLNIDTLNSSLSYYQAEKYNLSRLLGIYGCSRLGMLKDSVNVLGSAFTDTDSTNVTHTLGNKRYELSNHLGNVLTVITDKPIPHNNGGTVDYWQADIKSSQDYSPFGVILDGRSFGDTSYSRGFQGQEQDNEITEGYVNFTYRGYDPRIGRLNWAVDPLSAKYPWNSSYAFSENRVIDGIELEGLEFSGFNALDLINQKMTALFDNNFGKNMAISANDLTKGVAKQAWNAVINNLDIIGTVVTTTGYVMYLTPYSPAAPGIIKTGEGISLIATGVEVYDDVVNKKDYTNASIKIGITLVFRGTGSEIKKGAAKEIISENDEKILKVVNEAMGQAYNKLYVPNIQKVGDVTFDSNKLETRKNGDLIAKDLKTGKDHGVIRNENGSYDFKRKSESKSQSSLEPKSTSKPQSKSQPSF